MGFFNETNHDLIRIDDPSTRGFNSELVTAFKEFQEAVDFNTGRLVEPHELLRAFLATGENLELWNINEILSHMRALVSQDLIIAEGLKYQRNTREVYFPDGQRLVIPQPREGLTLEALMESPKAVLTHHNFLTKYGWPLDIKTNIVTLSISRLRSILQDDEKDNRKLIHTVPTVGYYIENKGYKGLLKQAIDTHITISA